MTVNKDRLNDNIKNLEILISFLKQAAEDKISIAEIGRQHNLTALEMNYELNNCFSRYFKKSSKLTNDDIEALLKMKDLPSTRLLKAALGYSTTDRVEFPYIDEDCFWQLIKENYSDSYYTVLSMYSGYGVDKPMSFEKIAQVLNCTRMQVNDMYHRALLRFDSALLYKIYNYEYYNKKIEMMKTAEFQEAKKAYDTLQTYMYVVEDIKALNEYIATNYPEVSKLDLDKVNSLFSIPISDLNLSNGLTNVLIKNDINTLTDIYMTSAIKFKNMSNFGKVKCAELLQVISSRNDTHPNRNTLIENLTEIMNK